MIILPLVVAFCCMPIMYMGNVQDFIRCYIGGFFVTRCGFKISCLFEPCRPSNSRMCLVLILPSFEGTQANMF